MAVTLGVKDGGRQPLKLAFIATTEATLDLTYGIRLFPLSQRLL